MSGAEWEQASPAAKRMVGLAMVAAQAQQAKDEFQAAMDNVAEIIRGDAPELTSALNLSDCTTRRVDELHAAMWVATNTRGHLTADADDCHAWARVLSSRGVAEQTYRVIAQYENGHHDAWVVADDRQVLTRDGEA